MLVPQLAISFHCDKAGNTYVCIVRKALKGTLPHQLALPRIKPLSCLLRPYLCDKQRASHKREPSLGRYVSLMQLSFRVLSYDNALSNTVQSRIRVLQANGNLNRKKKRIIKFVIVKWNILYSQHVSKL